MMRAITWTCPHCGCNTNSLPVHTAKCPVLHRDRYVAALDRGDGFIVSQPEWAYLSAERKLLSRAGLRLVLGIALWGDIAAYFGLGYSNQRSLVAQRPKREPMTPEVLRKARAALDAPLADDERHACARRGSMEFGGEQGLHSGWRVVDVW